MGAFPPKHWVFGWVLIGVVLAFLGVPIISHLTTSSCTHQPLSGLPLPRLFSASIALQRGSRTSLFCIRAGGVPTRASRTFHAPTPHGTGQVAFQRRFAGGTDMRIRCYSMRQLWRVIASSAPPLAMPLALSRLWRAACDLAHCTRVTRWALHMFVWVDVMNIRLSHPSSFGV